MELYPVTSTFEHFQVSVRIINSEALTMSRKSVLCNLFPNDLEVIPGIFHAKNDSLSEVVKRLVKPIPIA